MSFDPHINPNEWTEKDVAQKVIELPTLTRTFYYHCYGLIFAFGIFLVEIAISRLGMTIYLSNKVETNVNFGKFWSMTKKKSVPLTISGTVFIAIAVTVSMTVLIRNPETQTSYNINFGES